MRLIDLPILNDKFDKLMGNLGQRLLCITILWFIGILGIILQVDLRGLSYNLIPERVGIVVF
jgi:hypothetical protein